MSGAKQLELGYGFALPRLLARSSGRAVRRAQFSAVETYSACLLVFAIHYLFLARLVLIPLLAAGWIRIVSLLLLPVATWIYFLLLYYAISLLLRLFRRLGIFMGLPNNRFQGVIIVSLTTIIAALFVGAASFWLKLLGGLWLGLIFLNLLATAAEKLALDAK